MGSSRVWTGKPGFGDPEGEKHEIVLPQRTVTSTSPSLSRSAASGGDTGDPPGDSTGHPWTGFPSSRQAYSLPPAVEANRTGAEGSSSQKASPVVRSVTVLGQPGMTSPSRS